MENNAKNSKSVDLAQKFKLPTESKQHVVRKIPRLRKIVVRKPGLNLHIFLAIVCGLIIGTIASLLLALVGGRFL